MRATSEGAMGHGARESDLEEKGHGARPAVGTKHLKNHGYQLHAVSGQIMMAIELSSASLGCATEQTQPGALD